MNHQTDASANCNMASPLPTGQKMVPIEIFSPQSYSGVISVSSIGDDDDFPLRFVSPRDRKKLMSLGIQKENDDDDDDDDYRGDANEEEEEEKGERSQREKRNSSIPMIPPQRKMSGDLLAQLYHQRPSNSSTIETNEEDDYLDSDVEEETNHNDDDGADLLDLSKRENFNSSFPMLKPQRKKSGDLLAYLPTMSAAIGHPTKEEGEDDISIGEECIMHGTYYYSDCEESLNGTACEDGDDLDMSRREKFNSSFPMLKPQRRKSVDSCSHLRMQPQTLPTIRSSSPKSREGERGHHSDGEVSLHLFYDNDEKKERSQREKRNSSIPIIPPQRKKSGDLVSTFQQRQLTHRPTDPSKKEGESSYPDCDSDLEESEHHGNEDLLELSKRDESINGTQYDPDMQEDTSITMDDLEEESFVHRRHSAMPSTSRNPTKWGSPDMAGLLKKPMRRSSMGHCAPMRTNSRSYSSRSGASHSFNRSRSTHSTLSKSTDGGRQVPKEKSIQLTLIG